MEGGAGEHLYDKYEKYMCLCACVFDALPPYSAINVPSPPSPSATYKYCYIAQKSTSTIFFFIPNNMFLKNILLSLVRAPNKSFFSFSCACVFRHDFL